MRRGNMVALAGAVAAVGASAAILFGSSTGGSIDVIVGGTPTPTSTPSSSTANLWVDSSGGTCTRQASPSAYSDAAACSSFDAANDKCANGDVVLVKAASYGAQTITGANGRSSMCTVQAAPSEAVTFDTLTTNGDWLTIKDMDSHYGESHHMGTGGCVWCDQQGGSNLLLDDVNLFGQYTDGEISGGSVHATATNVTWQHSQLGTAGNTGVRLCGEDDEPFRVSVANNITIAYDTFHPFRGEEGGGCGAGNTLHLETFRLWDTINGIKFVGNYFDNSNGDDSFTIFNGKGGCDACPPNDNVTIVNNYFGWKCCGYSGPDISFGQTDGCLNAVVAYNFFHDSGGGVFTNCTNLSTFKYVGNLGYNSGGCVVSSADAHNLWVAPSHGTCAGNTWVSGAAFPSPPDSHAGGDTYDWSPFGIAGDGFHLATGSAAINAGENTVCTASAGNLDIDGRARSGVCDAGPDEFGN